MSYNVYLEFLLIQMYFSITFPKDNKDCLNQIISKAKLCSKREFSV